MATILLRRARLDCRVLWRAVPVDPAVRHWGDPAPRPTGRAQKENRRRRRGAQIFILLMQWDAPYLDLFSTLVPSKAEPRTA
jgi:hypothetical protein